MYGKLPLHQHSSSVTPPAHCPVVPRQMNSIYLYLEMEIKDAGEDKEAVRGAETIKAAFQHEPLVWMPDKASVNKGVTLCTCLFVRKQKLVLCGKQCCR